MKFSKVLQESKSETIVESNMNELLRDPKQWEHVKNMIKVSKNPKQTLEKMITAYDVKTEQDLNKGIKSLVAKYGENDPINKLMINQIKVSARSSINTKTQEVEKAKKDNLVSQEKTRNLLGRKKILPIVGK